MTRQISAGNFSIPYVDGTWMVAVRDTSGAHQVTIVGPDPSFELGVLIDIDLLMRIGIPGKVKIAKKITEVLNQYGSSSPATTGEVFDVVSEALGGDSNLAERVVDAISAAGIQFNRTQKVGNNRDA